MWCAEVLGQGNVDFLFLDEQADGKTLQGTHVSGDTAGEFVWKPGTPSTVDHYENAAQFKK